MFPSKRKLPKKESMKTERNDERILLVGLAQRSSVNWLHMKPINLCSLPKHFCSFPSEILFLSLRDLSYASTNCHVT